jgi:CheY-like chemotaxis protein
MARTKLLLTFNNTNYRYSDCQQPENGYIDKQSDSKSHNQLTTSKIPENPFCRRILIVDDDVDVTLTFRSALENDSNNDNGIIFEIRTYNDPLLALSEFRQNFYDLMLLDINMPKMNGFEFCERILKLDVNVKVCFMSGGEINHEALREIHPAINIGCFIKKPVPMDYFIKRIKAEIE